MDGWMDGWMDRHVTGGLHGEGQRREARLVLPGQLLVLVITSMIITMIIISL